MFEHYHADYNPASTPAELASWSDLVISGTIKTVREGRSGKDGSRTVVMVVNSDKIIKGKASDTVCIELPNPGTREARVYAAAVPTNADVVLYLQDSAPLDKGDPNLVEPAQGRPAGTPLYQPVSPQGLILGDVHQVVQILDFSSFQGASLVDFLPNSVRFPTPDAT
jgi:hypothetical protein